MTQRRPRAEGGLFLESTRAEQLGVLPGEERLVRDVMSRQVVVIDPSASLSEAADAMAERHVSTLVVCTGTGVKGFLTEHDVAMQARTDALRAETVGEAAGLRRTIFCRDDDILADALLRMKEHGVSALPVLNREGALVGLLSLLDVAASVATPAAPAWLDGVRK
jgi:homoserine O-acetyltransferase